MQDISGYGFTVQIRGTVTFPDGRTITQLADDTDVFDIDPIDLGDAVTGVNGDLIAWSKTSPLSCKVAVVPDGEDDVNLQALFEANRAAKGKLPVLDVITLVGVFPNGRTITFTKGKPINFMPGNSIASAGRLKSKVYTFKFENRVITS